MLSQQLNDTQNQLATTNTRMDNLLAERSQIKDRYANLLKDTSSDPMITGGLAAAQVPMARWQGTISATGLLAQALAAARTAFGRPAAAASSE